MRESPPHTVWWFEWKTLWGTYDVVLADPKKCKAIKHKYGLTDLENRIIYLAWNMPLVRLQFTFFHESIHSVLGTPGDEVFFARVIGCKKKHSVKREENVAVLLASRLAPSLFGNGLMKLPKLPKLPRKARHRRAKQR